MKILPAIDLRNGKCVNLVQGLADQETIFSDHPVEIAKQWISQGGEFLHLVDLDGAFQRENENLHIVKEIVETVDVPMQLGGGIRTMTDLEKVISIGVSRAILGTIALKNPEFVEKAIDRFGDRIAVGIDANNGKVATEGWIDVSEKSAIEFAIEMKSIGVQTIIYTDIKSDGMLSGPNLSTTREMIETTKINIIASGGITTLDDLRDLKSINASGAIIGRAIYTGALDLATAIAIAEA